MRIIFKKNRSFAQILFYTKDQSIRLPHELLASGLRTPKKRATPSCGNKVKTTVHATICNKHILCSINNIERNSLLHEWEKTC